MPTRSFRFALLLTVLAVGIAAPASADLWYEHYARAEKAIEEENWQKAVEELNQALEKKGDSGTRVRTYGMKVVAYLPYLKLGIAYYHLGQLDAALQAFETEERLGAVAGSAEHQSELDEARGLVLAAREAKLQEERRRIAQIVASGLTEARRLESAGQLQQATVALGRVLSVDPDNREAAAELQQLRTEIAERKDAAELETRRTDLVERGERSLSQGDWAGAASLLRQALDLAPDPQVESLLARAREGLGAELEAVETAQRDRLVDEGLDAVRSLETNGRYEDALARLEPVLALEPGNGNALALQERLLEARDAAQREGTRRGTVRSLLDTMRHTLAAGQIDQSLAAANEVLALEPSNAEALESIAVAYRRLNQDLLGTAPRQNIPPAISFHDLRREMDDGLRAERVRSAAFRLSGVVIDDSPVEVGLYDSHGGPTEATLREQQVGGIFITEFSFDSRLDPGLATFRLTATDGGGLSTSSEYSVLYARPMYRAPWFYAVCAAAALAVGATLWGRRSARLRELRTRRFNPYVAGAPVISESLFFGRRELIDRILQTLHNNSLLLHGERRIGKTSIQHQIRRRLREIEDPDYEFFPAYVDLQGVPEELFFQSLAEDVFEELELHLDGLEPSIPETGEYSYRLFVRDLHKVIRTLQDHSDKRVKLVLLIDEVDELNDYDPRVNQRLRSLFMKSFAEQIVAVVSGVEIRKRWEREGSPWYNFFEEIEVGALRPEEARALVEAPIHGVFKVDEGVVERILALTRCRPYPIQKLCMAVVSRMYEQGRDRITVDDIDAVGRSVSDTA